MVRTFDLVSSDANIQYFRGILKICAQIAETQASDGAKEEDTGEGVNEVESTIVGIKKTSITMTIYLQEKEKAPKVDCDEDFQVSHIMIVHFCTFLAQLINCAFTNHPVSVVVVDDDFVVGIVNKVDM